MTIRRGVRRQIDAVGHTHDSGTLARPQGLHAPNPHALGQLPPKAFPNGLARHGLAQLAHRPGTVVISPNPEGTRPLDGEQVAHALQHVGDVVVVGSVSHHLSCSG